MTILDSYPKSAKVNQKACVYKKLAILLLCSAFCVVLGGLILAFLIPLVFSLGAFVLSGVMFALSFFVAKGSTLALNVSTALSIVLFASLAIPAHRRALSLHSPVFMALNTLEILGFYVFPACFLGLRFYTCFKSQA
jgi:hypothetical protein